MREIDSETGQKGFWRYRLEDVYHAALWALANKGRAMKEDEAPFALAWNLLELLRSDKAVEKALWLKVLDLAARGRENAIGGGVVDDGEALIVLERFLGRHGVERSEDMRGLESE